MRVRLVGLGGLQVMLTASAGMALAWFLGLAWQTALAVGLIFSLSSTAIVLQTLNEKSLVKTEGGRSAFSVLLFQDIAVIPMLALIPLLALAGGGSGEDAAASVSGASLVSGLPGWAHALVVAAVGAVIIGGSYLSWPLFRYVVRSGLREVFTATALMLVIGIAALMSLVNLSPALGAFLAGVVLANSEFRHELEANIEPFKGLLLGLFFITVGAGINFEVLASEWGLVLSLSLAVIVLKALILLLVVAISMFLTPALFIFYEQAPVIVAGAGRFGQIICRLLKANKIPIVVLDIELEQIENVHRIGIKSYFGDASRPDLLETAGIEQARVLVVAIDDRDRATRMVHHVKHLHPEVWVLARAFDRGHGYQLREAGADDIVSETYHSALELGSHALTAMGVHPMRARQMSAAFIESETAHEDELFEAWKEIEEGIRFSPRYSELFMKLEETLSSAMEHDWDQQRQEQNQGPIWASPEPPASGRIPGAKTDTDEA